MRKINSILTTILNSDFITKNSEFTLFKGIDNYDARYFGAIGKNEIAIDDTLGVWFYCLDTGNKSLVINDAALKLFKSIHDENPDFHFGGIFGNVTINVGNSEAWVERTEEMNKILLKELDDGSKEYVYGDKGGNVVRYIIPRDVRCFIKGNEKIGGCFTLNLSTNPDVCGYVCIGCGMLPDIIDGDVSIGYESEPSVDECCDNVVSNNEIAYDLYKNA